MLDERQPSDGVKMISKSNQPASISHIYSRRSHLAEEGRGAVMSDVGSIRVDIDTLVTEVGAYRPANSSC